jgi:hypothetical protein
MTCWECGRGYAPLPDGAARGEPRFCSYECRVVYIDRGLRAAGIDACPACLAAAGAGHADGCRHGVGERDGWICQLCWTPVDWTRRNPDPLMATMDHRVPRSSGGVWTSANLRLAHRVCNTVRDHLDDEEWSALTGIAMPGGRP